jgi:tetratricopeptide (TPR) repeat protein
MSRIVGACWHHTGAEGLWGGTSPRAVGRLVKPTAILLAALLLAPVVVFGDQESVRTQLVQEILKRIPPWPKTQVEVPIGVYEDYLRARKAGPKLPVPPEAVTLQRAAWSLKLEGEEAVFEVAFDVVRLPGAPPAGLKLLPAARVWREVAVDGQAAELRRSDDGWFYFDPSTPGRFSVTAKTVLKPARTGDVSKTSFPMPRAAWTTLAVDLAGAWEVRAAGAPLPIVGGERGTRGLAGLVPGDRLDVEWQPPQPVVRREARIESEAAVGWTLADGVHQIRAGLDLRLWGGEAEELVVNLPAGADRVSITGPDVREVKVQGTAARVILRGAITQRTRLAVSFDVPRPASGRMTLPVFGVAGASPRGGTLAVAGGSGAVLLELDSKGLVPLALYDLPVAVKGLLAAPPVYAYQLTSGPWEARVDVVDLAEFPVRETLVDSAFYTVLFRPTGQVMTKVVYEVRNRAQQYMKVELPPGAQLLVAHVNEQQKNLARGPEGSVFVPLEKSVLTTSGLVSFPVELVYVLAGPPLAAEGDLRLQLPRTDLPVAYARCALMVPEGMKAEGWKGALREVPRWSSETAQREFEYGTGHMAAPAKVEVVKRSGDDAFRTRADGAPVAERPASVRTFALKNADAAEIKAALSKALPGSGAEDGLTFEADAPTHSLVVHADEDTLAGIRDLVESLDAKASAVQRTPANRLAADRAAQKLAQNLAAKKPAVAKADLDYVSPEEMAQLEKDSKTLQGKNNYRAAVEFYNRNNYEKASELFSKVLEVAPESTEADNAKKYLGNVEIALGKAGGKGKEGDRAAQAASKAIQMNLSAGNAELLTKQQEALAEGDKALRAGNAEQARNAYQVAVNLSGQLKTRGEADQEQKAITRRADEYLQHQATEGGREAYLHYPPAALPANSGALSLGGANAVGAVPERIVNDLSASNAGELPSGSQIEIGQAIAEQQMNLGRKGVALGPPTNANVYNDSTFNGDLGLNKVSAGTLSMTANPPGARPFIETEAESGVPFISSIPMRGRLQGQGPAGSVPMPQPGLSGGDRSDAPSAEGAGGTRRSERDYRDLSDKAQRLNVLSVQAQDLARQGRLAEANELLSQLESQKLDLQQARAGRGGAAPGGAAAVGWDVSQAVPPVAPPARTGSVVSATGAFDVSGHAETIGAITLSGGAVMGTGGQEDGWQHVLAARDRQETPSYRADSSSVTNLSNALNDALVSNAKAREELRKQAATRERVNVSVGDIALNPDDEKKLAEFIGQNYNWSLHDRSAGQAGIAAGNKYFGTATLQGGTVSTPLDDDRGGGQASGGAGGLFSGNLSGAGSLHRTTTSAVSVTGRTTGPGSVQRSFTNNPFPDVASNNLQQLDVIGVGGGGNNVGGFEGIAGAVSNGGMMTVVGTNGPGVDTLRPGGGTAPTFSVPSGHSGYTDGNWRGGASAESGAGFASTLVDLPPFGNGISFNRYSGGTAVGNGTLSIGNAGAMQAVAGADSSAGTATLNVDGVVSVDRRSVTVEGKPQPAFQGFACGEEETSPRKFVFVVDRSGSMTDSFDLVKRELKRSISDLSDDAEFHIIFMSSGPAVEMPQRKLVNATERNKQVAFEFIDSIVAQGETSPDSAVTRAMALRPDVAYVLTDGEFNWSTVGLVRNLNPQGKTTVNTISFLYRGGEKVLKEIADQNGGSYKFVSEDELSQLAGQGRPAQPSPDVNVNPIWNDQGGAEGVQAADGNLAVANDAAAVARVQELLGRLRSNWGQRVAVGSRNILVRPTAAKAAGIAWKTGANGVRFAVVNEGQLLSLMDIEQRQAAVENPAAARGEARQDAIVGTEARLANRGTVTIARAADDNNTLSYNGNDVQVQHDDYLLVDNDGAYLTAVKTGRMQHWSEEAEPVRFPGVPAIVVVPVVGRTVKFEKTLLDASDRLELVVHYTWQGEGK